MQLYNVIVETHVASKLLLERGQLQQRTTFVPLNQIKSSKISDDVLNYAKSLVGAENVDSALSLITYDKKLRVAMEYVFGNVLICKDLDVAKKVAFHNRIRKRCVTLDGDVVDPAGTLSGGAAQKGEPILSQIAKILEEEVRAIEINSFCNSLIAFSLGNNGRETENVAWSRRRTATFVGGTRKVQTYLGIETARARNDQEAPSTEHPSQTERGNQQFTSKY